jgi:GntR family transcriptional regulator, trigonelline degradation regulator
MFVSKTQAPVRQQTINNLRSAIVEGRFRPGQRLLEKDLCKLTGVSRTSIRESLRQLEAEGLIKMIPNKGPVVAAITVDEAIDLYQIRQVLEGLACRLFAERADPSRISALVRAVDLLERAAHQGDMKNVIDTKDEFYSVILEGCGNALIQLFIKSLHARIAFLRSMSLSEQGRALESLSEIKGILDAIQRRDPEGAWNACIHHIREAESIAVKVLREMENSK